MTPSTLLRLSFVAGLLAARSAAAQAPPEVAAPQRNPGGNGITGG